MFVPQCFLLRVVFFTVLTFTSFAGWLYPFYREENRHKKTSVMAKSAIESDHYNADLLLPVHIAHFTTSESSNKSSIGDILDQPSTI